MDKDWANISDRVLTHMSGRIVGKYYKNNLHPKTRSRREWRQLEMQRNGFQVIREYLSHEKKKHLN